MSYPMNIGEAAQAAGVSAKMIRHYESQGLIPQASRTDSGYRQYTAREVSVLRFIRQSRSMGFSIKQIEQLLGLWADTRRESREVMNLAREHIAEIDRKMAELTEMKTTLQAFAADCHGDDRPDCPILGRLSGQAAAPISAPKAAPVAVPARAARVKAPAGAGEAPGHGGLVAWMHGLARPSPAEAA